MKTSVFLLFVFFATFISAQNNLPTITFKDSSQKQFKRASFNYNNENYIIGIKTKTSNNDNSSYNISEISSFKNDGTNYIIKQYKSNTYLFEEVIKGSLSVYKSGSHYFLENEEHGFREILEVVNNGKKLNKFDHATLSIFVNKCKAAQEQTYNKSESISYSVLKSIVEAYNSCNLSDDVQFASNVIELSNAPKEVIEVGVSVGYNFLNNSFDNLSSGVTNSYGTPVIGAQVYFNTNMLKKNIVFVLLVDYSFPNEFKSTQNSTILKIDLSYLTTMIGARYTFNNINKTLTPYLGFNGGIIVNSMSSVSNQQNSPDSELYNFESTNKPTCSFGAGTYVHIGKQKIDFNLTYQPEVKFLLLSTNILHRDNNYYKSSGFQLKATYVF